MHGLVKLLSSGRVATALAISIVFCGAVALVPTFGSQEARTMPLVIGVPAAVMAIIILIREITTELRDAAPSVPEDSGVTQNDDRPNTEAGEDSASVEEPVFSARTVWMVGGLLAASVAILGHQVGMTVFLLISQWLIFRLSIVRTLISTVIVMVVFGWFWADVLHLPVYGGLLSIPVL